MAQVSDPVVVVLNKLTQGTFISVNLNVDLNIKDSTFINGISYSGGAIYLSGSSTMNIDGCSFLNNYA
jgi:hypothetical protein